MSHDPWVWVAAILSLCIFSFLYKDNPLYRFAEHIFVGVSLGYIVTIVWHNMFYPNVWTPIVKEGNLLYIIPAFIGALYITRFIPKVSWLVRIPISWVLGWTSGVSIPLMFQANIFKQVQGTIVVPEIFGSNPTEGIGALIVLFGVLGTLSYFFFSRKETGVMGNLAKIGIVFIMIGFGATFGLTVMARLSLLIGRFQFLLRDWLGIIK